ncbi:MAG: hypothetical protein PHD04_03060 [Candidatus Pacebacteria bacterium]|nr:hypothetical protein [Candidatus Paceibacterota bacterium]
MSRTSTLILLGALTILAPFSGLPISIRNVLAIVFGACVLGIGLSMRVREVRGAQGQTAETPVAEPEPAPPTISPI